MRITPLNNKVLIQIDEPKVGMLDISSKKSALEKGEIIEANPLCDFLKKGDKILFKAWAVDLLTVEGETYYFIDFDSPGLCGKIE